MPRARAHGVAAVLRTGHPARVGQVWARGFACLVKPFPVAALQAAAPGVDRSPAADLTEL